MYRPPRKADTDDAVADATTDAAGGDGGGGVAAAAAEGAEAAAEAADEAPSSGIFGTAVQARISKAPCCELLIHSLLFILVSVSAAGTRARGGGRYITCRSLLIIALTAAAIARNPRC